MEEVHLLCHLCHLCHHHPWMVAWAAKPSSWAALLYHPCWNPPHEVSFPMTFHLQKNHWENPFPKKVPCQCCHNLPLSLVQVAHTPCRRFYHLCPRNHHLCCLSRLCRLYPMNHHLCHHLCPRSHQPFHLCPRSPCHLCYLCPNCPHWSDYLTKSLTKSPACYSGQSHHPPSCCSNPDSTHRCFRPDFD